MSVDDYLWQQSQFRSHRINFERKENGVEARALLCYRFLHILSEFKSRRLISTSTVNI